MQAHVYLGTRNARQASANRRGEHRGVGEQRSRPDMERVRQAAASAGLNVDAVDMTRETTEQIRRRLSEDGIHAAAIGHGLVDEPVMRSLNMSPAVSDHLFPVMASR